MAHLDQSLVRWIFALSIVLLTSTARSGELTFFNGHVTDKELSETSGGFVNKEVLGIDMTWIETASVNGVSVLDKSFSQANPPSIEDIRTFIQLGPGNDMPIVNNASLGLMVIQNTLNDKLIMHNVDVGIVIRNADMIRGLNISSMLTHQLINSIH